MSYWKLGLFPTIPSCPLPTKHLGELQMFKTCENNKTQTTSNHGRHMYVQGDVPILYLLKNSKIIMFNYQYEYNK
jgi:hypothetical protein